MDFIKIAGLLILAGILVFVSMVIYDIAPRASVVAPGVVIADFEACARAGNPVMESYPRQCRTADGQLFVENVPRDDANAPIDTEPIDANGCVVAGCSGQLCVSAAEALDTVTTCEYRAEYACYREASCEPQADGTCGWTQTPELQRCLAAPPSLETSLEVM